MSEEMLAEDTKYLEEILTLFKVTKYKLSETPSRFKIILHPKEFHLKTLHDVQEIKTPVGIEIDLKNGIFLECLKAGASRKRRRISLETFKGNIPEKYRCGRFESAIRVILGIEDICEFKTSFFYQKINGLFRRPFPKLIVERKDDTVSSMQTPKEHTNRIRIISWKSL